MNAPITVLGAGLAGSLMAILLARRGIAVQLLERRSDPRTTEQDAGRSINLALAQRGIHALKQAGLYEAIAPLTIAMRGRMVHDLNGATQFIAYGQRAEEVIYSISRPGLNEHLLRQAETFPHVKVRFDHSCIGVDLSDQQLIMGPSNGVSQHKFTQLIAADGYHSMARAALLAETQTQASVDVLPHGYKELTIPADEHGGHQLETHALHIWPRGRFMLIALPNLDGSFTATLFLAVESVDPAEPSFASLTSHQAVRQFFNEHFADALRLMPDLESEFFAHPTGSMATVRSPHWSNDRNAVLIGDAAHAIVPFHGQGMNCAFEDCIELDALLAGHDFEEACRLFTQARRPNANAIADMALENYLEMRDTVREPDFLLKKQVSFELERRHPQRFIPRYSMVMFRHDISYATAQQRGRVQENILARLTATAQSLAEVDMRLADELIHQGLTPLSLGACA